ncbi:hypothetical protein [Streptomyces sp. NPDC046821]|uniref:hypothetical protein n=1 Tax=Streptomyces sp. NPDC046821 TaxID=3154702 RepID=UPI0033C872F1
MSAPRSRRLAHTPVVVRDGQWWLVSDSGSVLAADPEFTAELDRFAASMTAADQAVALLRVKGEPPAPARPGGRR